MTWFTLSSWWTLWPFNRLKAHARQKYMGVVDKKMPTTKQIISWNSKVRSFKVKVRNKFGVKNRKKDFLSLSTFFLQKILVSNKCLQKTVSPKGPTLVGATGKKFKISLSILIQMASTRYFLHKDTLWFMWNL